MTARRSATPLMSGRALHRLATCPSAPPRRAAHTPGCRGRPRRRSARCSSPDPANYRTHPLCHGCALQHALRARHRHGSLSLARAHRGRVVVTMVLTSHGGGTWASKQDSWRTSRATRPLPELCFRLESGGHDQGYGQRRGGGGGATPSRGGRRPRIR